MNTRIALITAAFFMTLGGGDAAALSRRQFLGGCFAAFALHAVPARAQNSVADVVKAVRDDVKDKAETYLDLAIAAADAGNMALDTPLKEARAKLALARQQAIRRLSQEIEKQPKSAVLFLARGKLHHERKDYRAARADAERTFELKHDAESLALSAETYLDEVDFLNAINKANESLSISHSAAAFAIRGIAVALKVGAPTDAAQKDLNYAYHLYKSLPVEKRSFYVANGLGLLSGMRGEFQTALRWYDEQVRMDKTGSGGYGNIAGVNLDLKDYPAAIKGATIAINIDPDDYGAFSIRSAAYRGAAELSQTNGDIARARLEFTSAIADANEAIKTSKGRWGMAHFNLGAAHAAPLDAPAENLILAVTEIKKGLALDPGLPDAEKMIAAIEGRLRRLASNVSR
jgi:tetratricopeptide (TPR) repeat protein